ncbi:MAG: aminoacyl-tRNA hydrolase [Helicobacteraceae bacterium]|jgi:PTH1 family peptidyl-tRNA hydrolase|nr:aminoacyl-tRNA hydrolase [Helicobacteraceae bacterium]
MTLFAGLGNPAREYENTRHNAGFLTADELIRRLKPSDVSKSAFRGSLYRSDDLLILKPLTYMNNSGASVRSVADFYGIGTLIVAHDDLDLSFGALRFKRGGANGGHKGLKSIDALYGADYLRVRIGIGRPANSDVISYVLSAWSEMEREELKAVLSRAADATLALLAEPLERVRSEFTQKGVFDA